MKLGIIRLYCGNSGKKGFYNIQEIGLAKSLVKKGIEVDIFFLSSDINEKFIVEEIEDNIRLITIKSNRFFNHGIMSVNILDEFNLDVIYLLSDNQLLAPNVINYCKKKKIPHYCYVGTIESDNNNFIKKRIMDLLAKRNLYAYKDSKIICKTDEIEEKLKSKDIMNTRVIPVGLDLDIIPKIYLSDAEIREEFGISKDDKLLLFVGRMEEYKKPLEFIELMRYISENSSKYRGIMIGNGSLKDKVIEKIKEYKLENVVLLIDKVSNKEIHKYYKISDVFINLNNNEIFGMSILEAMYQGCPVVAHSAPGPNYIINSGENGFIIDNYDNEIWFNAIKDVINNSNVKVNARKKIVEELNWDKISDEFIKLFDEVGGH